MMHASSLTAVIVLAFATAALSQDDAKHHRAIYAETNDNLKSYNSLFILKPDESVDKVLADPDAFLGKQCTVKWKKSKENVPEAGGIIEVEQILSVEWSAKK